MGHNVLVGNVYLVTEGEYSNYHVVCAFSTEAAAKEWAKQRNALRRDPDDDYGEYQVEKYEVFEDVPAQRVYWTARFTSWAGMASYGIQKPDEISRPQRIVVDPDETMPDMGIETGAYWINADAPTSDEAWTLLTDFLTEKFGDSWKDALAGGEREVV